jgi:D-glycero-alpha-D-manno-heptose-7-phosphate kinase
VDEIKHPAVRATLKHLKFDRGIEIHHDGDLPGRSGMGSSSAFTVGLLNAIQALQGNITSKKQLASEAIHIEQEVLKETVGSQDQVCAAYGGLNKITFAQEPGFSIQPITLSSDRLRELNSHLMLFYTGIKRTASNVASSYVADMGSRAELLRRTRDYVDSACDLLASRQDLAPFGEVLHEAWLAKRALSDKVSNAHVDALYEEARAGGALGGKLLGAGGGGFLLLFAPPSKQADIRARLSRLIHVPFKFEFGGSQIIFYDLEEDFSKHDYEREAQAIEAFRELEEP